MRRGPLALLAPLAVITTIVGGIGAIAVVTGIVDGPRADALDSFLPRRDADPRVVVVELDAAFMRRAELDPLTSYVLLIEAVSRATPRAVLLQHNVIDTARVQVANTEFATVLDPVGEALKLLPRGVLPIPVGVLAPPRAASRIPLRTRPVLASPASDVAWAVAADTTTAESSGAVARRLPLLVEVLAGDRARNSAVVPSLALIGWTALEHGARRVSERPDELRVGNRAVPTEGNQELRLSYARDLLPGGRNVITASQLVAGSSSAERVRGTVMVVGITDPSFADELPVPVTPGRLADVFVQANALNTLTTGAFLVPDDDAATVIALLIVAALLALGVLLLPLWVTPLVLLVAGVGWWQIAAQRADDGHLTDLVLPIGAAISAFVLAGGWRALLELRHRRRVSQMFSRYVPHRVAEQLLESGAAEAVAAGQRLEVAVLFCDLRGFTALSAELEPTQVRELLDHYYECVSALVLERDGTVMKFVGDEVFAVFGAPLAQPDAARVGLDCARAVIAARAGLAATLAAEGLPAIAYGIGFHTGEVVAAHVGSTTRRQYDVVGDTVNVGSRLCDEAGAGEIVLSGEARAAAGEPADVQSLGVLRLKGVRREVTGYRITRAETPAATAMPGVAGTD